MSQKIAFIDDEKSVLESVRCLFKGEPYQLFTFLNPVKALSILENEEFALVVADQVMPEMEGSLLIKRVREKWPKTEYMIMTSHDHLVNDLKKITHQVIKKPWDNEDLKSVIQKAVSHYETVKQESFTSSVLKTTILYVENDEMIIDVVDKILRRLGYDVVITTRCSEAIRLVHSQPDLFDLIITDMNMPGMNGLELAVKLREIRPDVPVILCTGFGDSIMDSGEDVSGIRAVLPKPFGVNEVDRVIKDVLE